MPKLPFSITHQKYHEICEQWLFDVAKDLTAALAENGISGEKAENIVGSSLFNLSMLYDVGGSYKVGGKFKPKLTFMNSVGELIVPDQDTYLHELAHGIAGEVFDEIEK